MRLAVLANWLWAAAICGEAALTVVLVHKRRWREFPALTALIALPMLLSLAVIAFRWTPELPLYGLIYRAYLVLNFLIQLAVVIEMARIVLRPTGTWVRDARRQFILSAFAGMLLAAVLAYMVAPPAPSRIESLDIRANLFTSLLICELFIAVSLASNRLGLGWRNHVMVIGQGFLALSIAGAIVDSLHSYLGSSHLYDAVESLRSSVYVLVLGYWSVQLWREEPARQPISPELRKFILALHERVQYDLGEAER